MTTGEGGGRIVLVITPVISLVQKVITGENGGGVRNVPRDHTEFLSPLRLRYPVDDY